MNEKEQKAPDKVREFAVFVDTNAIHVPPEKGLFLFSDTFSSWWKEVSQTKDVKLVVPELVYNELHQQKTKYFSDIYRKSQNEIKSVEAKLGVKNEKTDTLTPELIKKTIDQALFKQLKETEQCQIEPIPYNKISGESLKRMVENAIWRIPPFKNNHEGEGFRDAIVLETLRVFRHENPHTDVVFLSNDNTLHEAATKLSAQGKNLIVFKELSAVASYINAARTKFSPEFLHDVIIKAGSIVNGLPKSDFCNSVIEELTKKLALKQGQRKYEEGLGALASLFQTAYECQGNPKFHVLDTEFLAVVGDTTFHWNTPIGILCDYSRQMVPTILGSLSEDTKNQEKVRQIIVDMEWEAKVDQNKEFSDLKILTIDVLSDKLISKEEFYKKEEDEDMQS